MSKEAEKHLKESKHYNPSGIYTHLEVISLMNGVLKSKINISDEEIKEGDFAAYNWLDDEGNDNWKVGQIVKASTGELMYYLDDETERCGFIPITLGVKILKN